MISLSQIRVFCAKEAVGMGEIRFFRDLGVFVATNGRVMVSVSIEEVNPADVEETVSLEPVGYFPDWVPVMRDRWSRETQTPAPIFSGGWEDHVYSTFCDECGGNGFFECHCPNCRVKDHECEECKGTARVEVWRDWTARLASGGFASGHYVWQIMQLPEVSWYAPVLGRETIVPFSFGKTGQGLLMPMKGPASDYREADGSYPVTSAT